MSRTIHQCFYQYMLQHQPNTHPTHELTTDRLYRLLLHKMLDQNGQHSIFRQQFFTMLLRRIAQIIMNAVYKQNLPFLKIQQIVTVVGVLQHITFSRGFDLPGPVRQRLTKYIHSLVVLENLQTMRTIFQDSRNSNALNNYYQQVYKGAVYHRATQLMRLYGLKLTSNSLILHGLKCVVEQKEGNLQKYESQVTSEWMTLSLIYLTFSIRADVYKQKPVLANILKKYQKMSGGDECQRQINGDELCEFYNSIFLACFQKIGEQELQQLTHDIKTDIDVIGEFVVPSRIRIILCLIMSIILRLWNPDRFYP